MGLISRVSSRTYRDHMESTSITTSRQTEDDELLLLNHQNTLEESLHYEELINPSKNSVTCKTCAGLGRIPKERTNDLVALVPYNDERLQPKRTKCIVVTAVSITIVIFTLAGLFVVPRSMEFLEVDKPQKSNVSVDESGETLYLSLIQKYSIQNFNFYPVQLVDLDMKIMYENFIVKNATLNQTNISIGPRSTNQLTVLAENIIFSKEKNLNFIVMMCSGPWQRYHKVPLQFQTTVNMSHWAPFTRYELLQSSSYHFVNCEPNGQRVKLKDEISKQDAKIGNSDDEKMKIQT